MIYSESKYSIIFIVLSSILLVDRAACRLSCENRCCKGKNSSCFSFDKMTNKKCYCDTFCHKSKDCCFDYRIFCGNNQDINCILSNWAPWTQCNRKCGTGYQLRTRKIIVAPRNNGNKCEYIREMRKCENILCPVQNVEHRKRKPMINSKMLSSVARLLPDSGVKSEIYQQYNQKYDIRQHLYHNNLHQLNITDKIDKPYCAFYKIIVTFGSCDNFQKLKKIDRANWSQHFLFLQKDRKICATCYSESKQKDLLNQCQGTGYVQKVSRWRAIRSDNCHGYFKLTHKRKNCICPLNSFILI